MSYKIKQVTILDHNERELENYFPKELTESVDDYRKQVLDTHFPGIKQQFPELAKKDISILLTHKKIS